MYKKLYIIIASSTIYNIITSTSDQYQAEVSIFDWLSSRILLLRCSCMVPVGSFLNAGWSITCLNIAMSSNLEQKIH